MHFICFHSQVEIVINEFGTKQHIEILNLSLEVPPNAVESKVTLEIGEMDAIDSPPIPLDFGEMVLSDVIQIKAVGQDIVNFSEPVILSVNHGIEEMPELASIVIKCYEYDNKQWKIMQTIAGEG